MSRKIKRIQEKLDAIADDNRFSFKIDHEPIKQRNLRETDSYVDETTIIGREDDLEKIVATLLAASDDQTTNNNVSVLSIVGMAAWEAWARLRALAQLVYKDPRVREAFPLKMWTCVSDEGQDELHVKDILGNILGRNQDSFTLEHVQEQLRAKLEGKKFLLVLDDLWTEDAHQWDKLVKYLNGNTSSASGYGLIER